MLYLAFTLGLFGSLHCAGMCGPLAFNVVVSKGYTNLWQPLLYNGGRILTYILLGVVFGLIGSLISLTQIQKIASIVLGVFFIMTFIISKTPEQLFLSSDIGKRLNKVVYTTINNLLKASSKMPNILIGMVNGLLPCGLVYVAISGAIMASNVWGGMLFMLLFGLGTLPMMMALMIAPRWGKKKGFRRFQKALPYINLIFGIFLIYRAVAVRLPMQLDFLDAINNPIMCH